MILVQVKSWDSARFGDLDTSRLVPILRLVQPGHQLDGTGVQATKLQPDPFRPHFGDEHGKILGHLRYPQLVMLTSWPPTHRVCGKS